MQKNKHILTLLGLFAAFCIVLWPVVKFAGFVHHKVKMEQQIKALKHQSQALEEIVLDSYHNQKEIRVNHKLYDVVSYTFNGKQYVLKVLEDKVEKQIEKELHSKSDDNQRNNLSIQFTDWINHWFTLQLIHPQKISINFSSTDYSLVSRTLKTSTPPPRITSFC